MKRSIFKVWSMKEAPARKVRRYAKKVEAENLKAAEYHNKQSQRLVLAELQKGNELTVQTAFHNLGPTELRCIVSRLKKKGYNIISYRKEGENFKRYKLKTSC